MTNKNQKKQEYVTPMIETLNARVERGFQGSTPFSGTADESVSEHVNNSGNSYGQNALFN